MKTRALQYHMHDGPSAFRLELSGELDRQGAWHLDRAGELPHPRSAVGGWLSISRSLRASTKRDARCLSPGVAEARILSRIMRMLGHLPHRSG
jgi:hypothetical protein